MKRTIILNNFEDFIINEINFYDFMINETEKKIYIESSEQEIKYIIENLTQFFNLNSFEYELRNNEYLIITFNNPIKLYHDY